MNMEAKINFIADLKNTIKANNININSVSLNENAKQIELLLKQIQIQDNEVAKSNLESCINSAKVSQTVSSMERINAYIILGQLILFLIPAVSGEDNIKYLKQIAKCYLDIAKLVSDDRIKKISFDIADMLINYGNK